MKRSSVLCVLASYRDELQAPFHLHDRWRAIPCTGLCHKEEGRLGKRAVRASTGRQAGTGMEADRKECLHELLHSQHHRCAVLAAIAILDCPCVLNVLCSAEHLPILPLLRDVCSPLPWSLASLPTFTRGLHGRPSAAHCLFGHSRQPGCLMQLLHTMVKEHAVTAVTILLLQLGTEWGRDSLRRTSADPAASGECTASSLRGEAHCRCNINSKPSTVANTKPDSSISCLISSK